MKLKFKQTFFTWVTFLGLAMIGFTACNSEQTTGDEACCSEDGVTAVDEEESTSGCTPSNCRGETTKFGEAQVISDLRTSLIELKAKMEESTDPKFSERTYDMHDIVGETDEKSLAIIARELQLIEKDFLKKLNHENGDFELPENKASQVHYLSVRIKALIGLI